MVLAPGFASVALQPETKWHVVLAPGFAYVALQPGTKWHTASGRQSLLSDTFGPKKTNRAPSSLPLRLSLSLVPFIACARLLSPATRTTRPWSGGSSPEKIEDFCSRSRWIHLCSLSSCPLDFPNFVCGFDGYCGLMGFCVAFESLL